MSTKAKATPKAEPAKTIPEASPEITFKVLKTGSCSSLSDTGMPSYEVGADDSGETYYRLTSALFRGLFQRKQGKSRLYSLLLNYGVTSPER